VRAVPSMFMLRTFLAGLRGAVGVMGKVQRCDCATVHAGGDNGECREQHVGE